eukprot:TRINITY_DN11216_c0_g1_i7.p1 TRINITY_DN11216_c0_g1~~TRINITY_DN11216_c0_g1_i7.p1  ORF type:complete len:238 (-),score=56.62 TRINITY_DN11216_c0_g1_i7:59-772(-)
MCIRDSYTDKKYDKIELNEYSNVLKIAEEYTSAKQLMKEIKSGKTNDKMKSKSNMRCACTQQLSAPIVGSRIDTVHKKLKKVLLSDLFEISGDKLSQKCFKVHINVREVRPKSPREWIWVYDKRSKRQTPLSEAFKDKKRLPSTSTPFYKMQLYVQDKDSKDGDMHILMVSTLGDKCPNFLSLKLGRAYPGERELNELKRVYDTITSEFVRLKLAIEIREIVRKQPIFSVIDTVLTI